jgi:hypothetical protein
MYGQPMQLPLLEDIRATTTRIGHFIEIHSLAPFGQQTLNMWDEALTAAERLELNGSEIIDLIEKRKIQVLMRDLEEELGRQPENYVRVLDISQELTSELVEFLQSSYALMTARGDHHLEAWSTETIKIRDKASEDRAMTKSLLSTFALRQRAEEQATRATSAADSASSALTEVRKATGSIGEVVFGNYFEVYANREFRASWLFRSIALTGLLGTGVLGWLFFYEARNSSFSWSEAAFRGAILLAVGALSAYTGRLAAQHRSVGNWAKAIAVQMKSFGALIEPVEDGPARAAIYERLAARVLAAPPENGSPSTETGLTSQDLLALLLATRPAVN